MQRHDLVAIIGPEEEQLHDDDLDLLLELANQLEVSKPHPTQVVERTLLLHSAIATLHRARSEAISSANAASGNSILEDAADRIRVTIRVLRADTASKAAAAEENARHRHSVISSGTTSEELEEMARESGSVLHKMISRVVQHSMEDHGTIAWWECYESRALIAAYAASFVATMAAQNLKDAQ